MSLRWLCSPALVVVVSTFSCASPEPTKPAESKRAQDVEVTSPASATTTIATAESSAAKGTPSPAEIEALMEQLKRKQLEAQAGGGASAQPVAAPLPALDVVTCDAKLCIRAVDDGLDPFAGADRATLPPGVALELENAPLGSGRSVARNFVTFTSRGAARAKTEAELIKRYGASLPSDHALVFGTALDGKVRSYVAGPGVLSASELSSASAVPDTLNKGYRVALTFTDDGKRRFAAATAAMVQRRIAVVVAGEAKAVPVVMEKIAGGTASFSAGEKREAEALAKMLAP